MRATVSAVLVSVSAVLAAVTLAGCSLLPTRSQASSTAGAHQQSKLAEAQRTHEYPAPPARQTAFGSRTAIAAIEAFATGYINWTAATVSARMRALAAVSVGQARAAVSLAAAQTAQDYELARGGIANAGSVEAVARVLGAGDQYVVVTQERTTASNTDAYRGLRPAWHLALATVTRLQAGGWVVSSWQPEN